MIDRVERELILRAKNGSREAFEYLFKAHLPRLYRAAYFFLKNIDDAADICQEAFLRAYKNLSRFDEDRTFYPWIYRILKNLCLNKIRRPKNIRLDQELIDSVAGPYPDPEKELIQNEEIKRLRMALDKLPEMYREILFLKVYEDATYDEISEILSIPRGTVMSRLYNARQKVKQTILNLEGDRHGLRSG